MLDLMNVPDIMFSLQPYSMLSTVLYSPTNEGPSGWMASVQTKIFNTVTVSMLRRRKRRRLFNEVIREQTTSHFYPFIQEATSNLLLNLLRAPEDFLAHITRFVFLHMLFSSFIFCCAGLEQALSFQVHIGVKPLNQGDFRRVHGSRFLKCYQLAHLVHFLLWVLR